jgi:membrane fusion protein (multidrug efflux system)
MLVRPGQFVRVRVKGLVRVGAVLVPQRAVMQGQAGRFVYVVTPAGQAEVRPVVMGDWQGDQWFVLSGLKSGERVIVGGIIKVQPGAPLKVTPEPDPAPEAGKERQPA